MAEFQDFARLIERLCHFFERKQPAPSTLDEWWPELKGIDAAYYPTIEKYLKELDQWPKNFPGKILSIYNQVRPSQYRNEHPAHYAPWKYAEVDCAKCKGEGFAREKATVYNKDHTESMPLSARVICKCVEQKMTPF